MYIGSSYFICDKCNKIILISGEELKNELFQASEINCKIYGCKGSLHQVDEYMVRHIHKLNNFRGIETLYSCSGHIHESGSLTPYIKFRVSEKEDYNNVLNIAKRTKLKINIINEYNVSFDINESKNNSIILYLNTNDREPSLFRNENFWVTRLYLWDALLEDFILGLTCYFEDGEMPYED